ncbi:MAG: RnfABCDGE type electron transport complex subunit D [Elusimicrobia bacterium]|nr:RnfABCDGE type electron transport complex subunit D [Elusimicrobiota bacterium]
MEHAPNIRSERTTATIMCLVIIALLPAGVWGVYKFGIHSAYIILTSIVSCVLIEFIAQKFIFKRDVTIDDGSAVLTGLLLAYCLPPNILLWQVVVGSFVAIFIVKECFGGIGFNIFNPALIGVTVVFLMFSYAPAKWHIDGVSQASPLVGVGTQISSYLDLFIGNVSGSIGEVSKLLLILGALYLFYKRVISWHIPIIYILTVFGLSFLFKQDPIFQVLSGSLILGAFFMATDYVTGPLFTKGKIIFGFGCGLFTVLIRNYGLYPKSVCYAILIMNALVLLIDKYTKPRVYGKQIGDIMKKVFGLLIFLLISGMGFVFAQQKDKPEIGVIIGEPSGISGKIFVSQKNAIDIVAGFGSGLMVHVDYLWHDFEALKVNEGKFPLYYGAGVMIKKENFYVQGKIGIEYLFDTNPLGIFIEAAPAIGNDFVFQGGVGVRYRLK